MGVAGDPQCVELEVGQALFGAILQNHPRQIVEVGTGRGYSTCWLLLAAIKNQAEGHPATVHTLDIAHNDTHLWDEILLPTDNLVYLQNETLETALLPKTIDFLFHDASHNANEVISDLKLLLERIPVGGYIAIHDVNYSRQMGDAVVEFFDSMPDQFDYQEVSQGCGLGIAHRKALAPQAPVAPAPDSSRIKPKQKGKARKRAVAA